MVSWLSTKRAGPIGVDIGSRSVKLLQFNADRSEIIDAVRWDLPSGIPQDETAQDEAFIEGLRQARQGRDFRGKNAVLCLGAQHLYVQNIRVSKSSGDDLERLVRNEAEGKLPFAAQETDIRFLEAADVRQGDTSKREVVLLACHQPVLHRLLQVVVNAGLRPLAVDVEPCAVLRCYASQFRRDEDKQHRVMFVGASVRPSSLPRVRPLFVKYIDISGRHFDEAVAKHLRMALPEAVARRHNGDAAATNKIRVVRSLHEVARLCSIACWRTSMHSLPQRYLRGQPLTRVILGGG